MKAIFAFKKNKTACECLLVSQKEQWKAMQITERERENKYFGRNLHSFWMLSISDDTHLQCKGGGGQWIAVQAGISTLWFNIGWLPGNLDVPLRIKKNKQTKNWYMFLRTNRKRELQCWNLMTLKCHCSYPYKYTLSGYFIKSPVCVLINANI